MPIAHGAYDEDTRNLLAGVFDSAWDELQAMHPQTAQPHNIQAAREELAKRIAEVHDNGESDPETIQLLALRAFNRWLNEP